MSSREEMSHLGIEPPTSSVRFGYLSTIIMQFKVISDQVTSIIMFSTLIVPNQSRRANSDPRVWEIGEGDTYSSQVTKSLSLKGLGSIVHTNTIHRLYYSYQHSSQLHIICLLYHSTHVLEHAPIFLKCMVNEHVFMN